MNKGDLFDRSLVDENGWQVTAPTRNNAREFRVKPEDSSQWHKVVDGYLPKNRKEVLLRVKLHDKWNREVTLKGYRDFGECLGEHEKAWGYCDDIHNIRYDFVDGEEVIAWCELPKY